jgi:hypothetical protein
LDPLDVVTDEIQSQIRKARLLRQRGDGVGAAKIIDELIATHPDHPEALLLKAEALEQSGKIKDARDLLAPLVGGETKNVAIERKHAELVFKVAEREQLVNFALNDNLASLMNPEGARKSAGTAAFFSMLFPGFGQGYNGQFLKGIIFAAVAVFGWIGVLNLGIAGKNVTEWFIPSIITLGAAYVVAIIDAAVVAGKNSSAITVRPQRPVPPVDKPFE